MRVALAILCVGAVMFWLRFLAALVMEGMHSPSGTAGFRQRGKLITMSPDIRKQPAAPRTGRRIAL